MSNAASPRQGDPALLCLLDRITGYLTSILNMAGTALIFFVLAVVNLDIFGRFLFGRPVVGTTEIVIMSTTAVVYFQFAHALREGRIVRVDSLLGLLKARWPAAGSILDGVFNLIGAATFALLLYYTFPFLERTFASGDMYGNPLVFGAPKWPVRLVMVVGCSVAILQFVVLAARDFCAAGRGGEQER
jgi:TRAP-type mannitol/chloroaromatic compound transport system permease small subunit